jgi:hypothetical protein
MRPVVRCHLLKDTPTAWLMASRGSYREGIEAICDFTIASHSCSLLARLRQRVHAVVERYSPPGLIVLDALSKDQKYYYY